MGIEKPYDVETVRAQFPALQQTVRDGKPLIYLDNAATTQKPQSVLDALNAYYSLNNANVHRAIHELSERATTDYEGARDRIQRFLNAAAREEIIFTRGTTESINLVAQTWGRSNLGPGDEVIITEMEHHSNIVPWQIVRDQTGCTLNHISINDNAELNYDEFSKLLNENTKLVALGHISNATGTINPVEKIIADAHAVGALVLLDGAQSAGHMAVDVQALDVDFFAFSAHKVFGPTGFGVLYGKQSLLDAMPPWHGGGDMIREVRMEQSTWNDLPYKFEAGTPHIAGAIGTAAALDWFESLDLEAVAAYEHGLLAYADEALRDFTGLRRIGMAKSRASIISFVMDKAHASDIGTILDLEGIAVRTGHHCAMPVMQRFGVSATARASLACYNTRSDVDALVRGLEKVNKLFGM